MIETIGNLITGIGFLALLVGCAGMDSPSVTVPVCIVGGGMLLILVGVILGSISTERVDEYENL